MKIAYLILAHKNPSLIQKQIDFLSSDDSAFFIHIDAKCKIDEFLSCNGRNVFFSTERVAVYWGEYSMIDATVILMRQALAAPQGYDYCVLLSGSDYPLRSKQYIHGFFENNRGTEFISLVEIPNTKAGIPLSKITTFRISCNRPVYSFLIRFVAKLGFAQRDYKKYLGSLRPYGGVQWCALTRDACRYLLEFIEQHEPICQFFKGTFAPDETFFHTILGNSAFRSRIKKCVTYDDWTAADPHSGHPAEIGLEQLHFFEQSNKIIIDDVFGLGEMLFARKFSDENLDLVDRLEKIIEQKEINS